MRLSTRGALGPALGAVIVLCALPCAVLAQSTITVPDSGVGTAVVDHELEGKGDRFEEGRQVVFWTRVVGGEEGQRIQHVWLHDGEEVISIGLALGGPHWRTFSRKTLYPGSVGKWVVEARDADGRVLARAEFECVPAGSPPGGTADAS